jgi:amino acid adenylation domain-containing protein
MFMALMAAFNALLCRYTGQEDLLVGTPIANRSFVDTEGLIGLIANTLVLRTDLSGDPAFRELLKRVRDAALDAFGHQDLPFDRLVESLQPTRDMSHSPIFQVMFAMQNMPVEDLCLPGLTIRPTILHLGTARLDLTVDAWERPEGLWLSFEYSTDLFDAETISRLAENFRMLLTGVVDDPGARVPALPLLTEAERRQVLVTWNASEADYPADQCIHELFEAQAAHTPHAVAAVFGDTSLTYRVLNERANAVAHRLRAMGVGPDVRVGVCLERSLELLVGVLGILKAGGAYVPLDPAFPQERLAFMLEDAEAPVLLTQEGQEGLISALPAHGAALMCLDGCGGPGAMQSCENLLPEATPAHLAYVMYTSGSTGRPKGVQIPHRAVVNFLTSMRQRPGLTDQDVLVSVTTLSFDIAGLELFLPLIVGARVVIADRETTLDGPRLSHLLERSGATVMQATPATWRLLLQSGWHGQRGLKILCGGEALSRELATALRGAGGSLWNLYGPTETTIWSTVHEVQDETGSVPIGRPIANTQLYVLDRQGQPTPIGVPGELFIGGDGVARGYLKRAELTAAKFLPDPFCGRTGARMYRTGDLARYRPDGALEYLGRVDDQVKIRGFRIELGEVEVTLSQYPGVRQAVVVARQDGSGEQRLAAYLTTVPGRPPTARDLRSFLAERLPEYMVPSILTTLPEFPLTPNGKVDRRRLPAPERLPAGERGAPAPPRTETERMVARIWREVLDSEEVGIDDNFFERGGHSLLLVQVQSRLRAALGCDVSIVELFQYPTVRTVAAHLAGRQARIAPASSPVPVEAMP